MNVEEEPGKCTQHTAGAWAQASQERFAELTSGKSCWQQGLVATCKDSSNEAKSRRNGVAERWVGSCRRELLDHVTALNERHLRRLLSEYVSYHNRASYCPPGYVVENSKPFCCDVGIAGSRLLRRTRSTNLAAASVSSAR